MKKFWTVESSKQLLNRLVSLLLEEHPEPRQQASTQSQQQEGLQSGIQMYPQSELEGEQPPEAQGQFNSIGGETKAKQRMKDDMKKEMIYS